jgi:hypothetical protein
MDDLKFKKLSLEENNNILYIRINRNYIWINNFFTKVVDEMLTPHDLGNLVKEVVNGKDCKGRYSEVHIDIIVKNEEGLGGDACIDYFDSVLPDEMPCLIFKEGVDVKYVYYVDDE